MDNSISITIEDLRQAQNAVHRGLGGYLGFWPWGKCCHPRAWNSVETLLVLYRELEEKLTFNGSLKLPRFLTKLRFLSTQSIDGKAQGIEAVEALCTFYNELETIGDLPIKEGSVKPVIRTFGPQKYLPHLQVHLKPIVELQKILTKHQDSFLGAYLFGSYATRDFIPGWSDVDILLILSPHCFRNAYVLIETKRLLMRLQRYLYQIDPLQLHGFFVLTWTDLKWYPQFFFPLKLFEYSLSLFDHDEPHPILIRDDEKERIEIFQDQVRYFMDLDETHGLPETHIERKLFFHKVFTFPLYFLQALGIHCYKKHSFEIARKLCPEFNWSCLEKPSHWMRTRPNRTGLEAWTRRLLAMDPNLRACVLQSRLYRLVNRLREPLWQVGSIELGGLIEDMARLAKSCESYVRVCSPSAVFIQHDGISV